MMTFFSHAFNQFSRFCTGRLYGTYSEHRSKLVVSVSRWMFAFLLLHNLAAITSYGAYVASVANLVHELKVVTIVQRSMDELVCL